MAITHIETVTATAESTTIGVGKASFADLQDGDVLVMLNYGYEESPYAGLPLTTEPPSGWTVLGAQRNTTGYDWHSAILYKVMTDVASEPASWDWTLAVASESTLVVSQFRGVDNSDPIDTMIDQVYLADSGGVDVYAGNNYAITDGAMAISAIGFSHTVGAAPLILTAPSGWTKAAQAEIISSDYATSAIAYKEFTAAGPVDTTEWGVALDGHAQTAHSGCLWMVTLRPSGETPAGRV
ncbi:MAG: hypothetical protein JSW51_02165, partial [Gemmatimonadota bacterium]